MNMFLLVVVPIFIGISAVFIGYILPDHPYTQREVDKRKRVVAAMHSRLEP